MKTYHIHIKGIVQGVGFRPFVYKYAVKNNLEGWVNNTNDGVHIHINLTSKENADIFLHKLLINLPPLAVVTASEIQEIPFNEFNDFRIVKSKNNSKPNLLLTADVALCIDCKKELHHLGNRRYHYPFITCTNCGPRYSIINELPYDRPNTTMSDLKMCTTCQTEYDNPKERRHFSQTNSCTDCKIEMQLFENGQLQENFSNLDYIISQWNAGKIIAIKGIGGYLLTCDATNSQAVQLLRKRKKRPVKPFAVMYPNSNMLSQDVEICDVEYKELLSITAPIVLLELQKKLQSGIAIEAITKGLTKIGAMLPYTPLYELLLSKYNKPIVATSGNITDATIVYTDTKALQNLSKIADILLLNTRDIVIPQDDGVLQFTKKYKQRIVLRRSRGKAPSYINSDIKVKENTVLATGSMIKSTFGLLNMRNLYISQYLGNTEAYEAQLNYEDTYRHFEKIFQLQLDAVIIDKHPDYFATQFGKSLAKKHDTKIMELQHHKAHLYAVLGENNLLESTDKILGIIWDGTGLGDDGSVWGGEFFLYENNEMKRVFHLDEFPFILADKMVKEPRISAMAMVNKKEELHSFVKGKFSDIEWGIYKKLFDKSLLRSTSMGRLFDAVSSILLGIDKHNFEAEASVKLEQVAATYYYTSDISLLKGSYLRNYSLSDTVLEIIVSKLIEDIKKGEPKAKIATRFHITLVDYIIRIAQKFNIYKLAFSGGVFQNALLVDMIIEYMGNDYDLYFHKEFSPNDEGISFGQLMYFNNKV